MNAVPSVTAAVQLHELPVRLRGSRLAAWLLRLAGWRLLFDGLPEPRGIVLVYPHTSNWDFPVVMLAKWAIGWPVSWLAKASLFRVPLFGRWLRARGGVAIEQRVAQGAVGTMVAAMQEAQREQRFLWIGLAPEGTRSRAEGWRCGFYRVAEATGVPVALVRLDWARREVGIDSCWRVSGQLDADLAQFAQRLADARGRHPAEAAPVRALPPPRQTGP